MKQLRVLIGCEKSGVIRRAFRELGHDAWSCDLLPPDDDSEFHFKGDVLNVLDGGWDLGIFHPNCKRLANSGVLRLYKNGKKVNGVDLEKWQEMHEGCLFFAKLWNCKIKRICIENPVQHRHARLFLEKHGVPRFRQSIQPFEFGDPESKRTCLWLKELPALTPTNILPLPECGHWENQTPSGQNKLGPSQDWAAIRAKTYKGIAEAMATQWSEYIILRS